MHNREDSRGVKMTQVRDKTIEIKNLTLETKLNYRNFPSKSYCKSIKILEINKDLNRILLYIIWESINKKCYTKRYYTIEYLNQIMEVKL